jgi:fructokinase
MNTESGALYGGVEGGGTKFVCVVGTGPDDVRAEARLATTSPGETIGQALAFFRDAQARLGALAGIGIGSFGPVDLAPASPSFGFITSTPKPGWMNVDLAGPFRQTLGVPVAFDTDVNAAALGEWRWGAARGLDTFVYLTVGTGIGGGGLVGGQLMHGLVHPEMGHLRLPRDAAADPFPGACPFHGDCLEGLASGPALLARWGRAAEALPPEHPGWAIEARYLALALVNFICTLSPQRIVMGGGVMDQSQLFPLVRRDVKALLNDYVRAPEILEDIDGYVVPPALGGRAGVLGALVLAARSTSCRATAST